MDFSMNSHAGARTSSLKLVEKHIEEEEEEEEEKWSRGIAEL